jgi:hypothetical protein
VEKLAPEYCTAISAMLVGGIVYGALCVLQKPATQPA